LGGGETILLTHLLALDRAQFSPHVICSAPGGLVDELRAHSIPVEVISFRAPYFERGFLPVASLAFFPYLRRYLHANRIRIVHSNDIEAAYYAAPLAKLLRLPFVWTCHGWWLVERGWKSRFVAGFIPHIVTPTLHIKQSLVEINPRLQERITVIPFGVDTVEFAPRPRDPAVRAEFSIPDDAPLIVMLARFQAVKGHAVLLDAIPQILDACPGARFLFVGDAEFNTGDANATREAVTARVQKDPRLRAATTFAGFRRDIPRLLNATDILVCPSDFETYGMAIVEAMASGVPVVCTSEGGPSETMIDGETGYLVPPRDPHALAARVIQLAANPDLRAAFGKNGRARVDRFFAQSGSVRALQTLYQNILK
jgi:glycosyltransferase involved in cell wall biosynthesis